METIINQINTCITLLRNGDVNGIENLKQMIPQLQKEILIILEMYKKTKEEQVKDIETQMLDGFKKIIAGIEYQDTVLLADTLEYSIKEIWNIS